jgi:hypothetical protein
LRRNEPVLAIAGTADPRPPIPHAARRSTEAKHARTADSERTRNGLLKRIRRSVPHDDIPHRSTPSADAVAIDREPGDVRAMLSAFRAGTQRGETVELNLENTASATSAASATSTAPSRATSTHEKGS